MKVFVCFVLILTAKLTNAAAQNIDVPSTTWTVDHLTDLTTQAEQEYTSKFQTTNSIITWSKYNGDIIYHAVLNRRSK